MVTNDLTDEDPVFLVGSALLIFFVFVCYPIMRLYVLSSVF